MMGILYAWATKEYLLEKMSFGQIAMYLQQGVEIKWGKQPKGKPKTAKEMTADELKANRDKLRKQFAPSGGSIEGL